MRPREKPGLTELIQGGRGRGGKGGQVTREFGCEVERGLVAPGSALISNFWSSPWIFEHTHDSINKLCSHTAVFVGLLSLDVKQTRRFYTKRFPQTCHLMPLGTGPRDAPAHAPRGLILHVPHCGSGDLDLTSG